VDEDGATATDGSEAGFTKHACDLFGTLARSAVFQAFAEHWERHGGHQANDDDGDQDLDEREPAFG
jgi:hypothetical protein